MCAPALPYSSAVSCSADRPAVTDAGFALAFESRKCSCSAEKRQSRTFVAARVNGDRAPRGRTWTSGSAGCYFKSGCGRAWLGRTGGSADAEGLL